MPSLKLPTIPAGPAASLPRVCLPAWRALLLALLSLLLAALLPGAPSQAAALAPERWAALTHTAFKHNLNGDLTGGTYFAQDKSGFLWIATQSGLTRWDGYRTVKYVANAARSDALPDSFIMSLHVDAQGRLWAGTSSGGLTRYDAERDRFVRFPAGPGGVRNARVAALADDGAGGLWIGTGSGLDHIDAHEVVTQPAGADALNGGVEALLRDRVGTLWIGTRKGLYKRERGQRALLAVALPTAQGPASINALFQDSSGRVWIGTRTTGAFVIEPGSAEASAVRESGPVSTLHNERVISIAEVGLGEIWLATEGANGGIVAIDPLHGHTRRIRHQPDAPDSLHDNDVYALFRERSGMVYVANMLALSQHDPLPRANMTIRDSGGGTGRLSVPSMLAHPSGRLWLGVAGGGIEIIDPQLGGVGRIKPGPGSLPKGRVLAMSLGPDGSVYIGTQQGLYRSDADGRKLERVELPQRGAEAAVWALQMTGEVLWLGGLEGLWGYSMASPASPVLLRREEKSLGDPRITAIMAVEGALWVGTRTGLARVDRAKPQAPVELLPTDLTQADRLPPGYVSSMLLDRRGRLWLSSFGTGIVILEGTDPDGRRRFRRLGMAQGMPDSSVNMLLPDDTGAIWASTDAGLARVDAETLAIRPIGGAEGVHILNYWTNSGVHSAPGELVFGGLSGLTVVRPALLGEWHYQPPVVATRIRLNDVDIPVGRYNSGAGRKAAPIEVTPAGRERGFWLEFAALDFSAPEQNRYAYRLHGFDPDWIDAEAGSRRVSYNNLPPGDYVLQLRGSNRNGVWSTPLEVPVKVEPVWHQILAVRIAAAVLALGFLGALVQVRTAYLRRRQRELQAMVDERTAELRTIQAQLEQLAYADVLTGLANRRLFNDELRRLVAQARRDGSHFTLLLIDLDRFKQINDTLGHDAGDALLVAAADRLRAAVRESDRVFRLGGDEFAVLLCPSDEEDTIEPVCRRILDNMRQPVAHAQTSMQISASIGAAVFQRAESAPEELYKEADLALYQAKAAGRNTWRL